MLTLTGQIQVLRDGRIITQPIAYPIRARDAEWLTLNRDLHAVAQMVLDGDAEGAKRAFAVIRTAGYSTHAWGAGSCCNLTLAAQIERALDGDLRPFTTATRPTMGAAVRQLAELVDAISIPT